MPLKRMSPVEQKVNEFWSHITLNMRYRDEDTKFEGVASAITFYRHSGTRVLLKALNSGAPVEHWFDEVSLTPVDADGTVGFVNGGTSYP